MSETSVRPLTSTRLLASIVGLAIVTAAFSAAIVKESTSSAAPTPADAHARAAQRAERQLRPSVKAFSLAGAPRSVPRRSTGSDDATVGQDDGALPDGVTVFDDEYPGIANLDPDLLRALRRAATDAAHAGIEFSVNSGWRSEDYQNQLLREALSRYGSEEEAARWVATADTSLHVSGDAVDIGSVDATAWLRKHGSRYGLCPIYRNEPWHYELRPSAIDGGCPPMYADSSRDPRMQR